MAQPDIFRLLEISPNSSLKEVKQAYKKRRQEMDPQLTRQIMELDEAYRQALVWFKQAPRTPEGAARSSSWADAAPGQDFIPVGGRRQAADPLSLFTPAQLDAMRTLGAVPGCSIDAAKRAARRRGVPAYQVDQAAITLHAMGGSPNSLHYAVQILWKVLAAAPFLLAIPLYRQLATSSFNFFPGNSDVQLASWFSGMLLASTTVSILFTLVVPLLLFFICRRITAGKRKCHRLGITPASAGVAYSFSAIADLLILLFSLLLCIGGSNFYKEALLCWQDYGNVQTESYVTATVLDPQSSYRYRYASPFENDYTIDGNQNVVSRQSLYMDEYITGYDMGSVHELTISYLPYTGLVHESQIHAYELYSDYTHMEEDKAAVVPCYRLNRSAALHVDGFLELYPEAAYQLDQLDFSTRIAQISLGEFLGVDAGGVIVDDEYFLRFNTLEGTGRLICTLRKDENASPCLLALSFDAMTGEILGSALLEDWQCQRLYLLESGDFVALAFRTMFDNNTYSGGAWVSALLLDGETFKLLATTADTSKLSPFYEYTVGTVNAGGVDISFETHGGDTALHLTWEEPVP